MSKVSEAAERMRNCAEDYNDVRTVADAYLKLITKLKAHCDSRTNPGDHGLAFELLKEMGERHEANKH